MKISNIKLKLNESEEKLKNVAQKQSGIKNGYFKITKKSLDARDKGNIFYVYSVEIDDKPFLPPVEEINDYYQKTIAIIGFGPAGIFAGLRLARAGFKPIIIERGQEIDKRKNTNLSFFNGGKLNTESNIQYGEGGAGTFSDGKLNTGVNSIYSDYILSEFVKHGAPEEITYINKPHIGSDKLPNVIKSIREEIVSLGGKVLFDTKLVDLDIKQDKIQSVKVLSNGKEQEFFVDDVIMAIGHSARDTYKMLYKKGVAMEQKDCAIGFRVEHLQSDINKMQYGREIGVVADYKLTSNVGNRGVFSFCMCPGGVVVPSMSQENTVVTNGMSEFLRNKENANSAIVCQIKTSDYGSGILDGIDFIERIERKAFEISNSYSAPCQNVVDFINDKKSNCFGIVKPSFALGTAFAKMDDVLPKFVCENIRVSLLDMNKRLKGFANSGIITAPETRTSSPVRIVRGENLCSINVINLYPVGEVGYAGGIMSSAIDGIKVAEKIKQKYQK